MNFNANENIKNVKEQELADAKPLFTISSN